ncbi:hypothetical protein GCM10010983_36170 [Caulobacter rhizosphaerae]|nr:hypothetical protein GCM10010983_36170 [Caulobacter rhizosphaerae]
MTRMGRDPDRTDRRGEGPAATAAAEAAGPDFKVTWASKLLGPEELYSVSGS